MRRRDGLDEAALPVDDGHVAHAHLILEDEEEAGDDVAHERLCPEADRQPDDAGAGECGRGVHAQLVERGESRDDDDDEGQRVLQQTPERLRALGALDDVEPGAGGHVALELTDGRGADADDDVGRDQNDHDAQARTEQPLGEDDRVASREEAVAGQPQRWQRHDRGRGDEQQSANHR